MTGSRELQFPLHTDTQVHAHICTSTGTQGYTHKCAHTNTCTSALTHMHKCAHTCTSSDTPVHIYESAHTQTHAQVHSHICTSVHTHAQTRTHLCTYESAHPSAHIHKHAHRHTHQHVHRCSPSQGSQGILRMPLSPSRSRISLTSRSSTRLPTSREPGRWSLSISRGAFHSAGSWAWQAFLTWPRGGGDAPNRKGRTRRAGSRPSNQPSGFPFQQALRFLPLLLHGDQHALLRQLGSDACPVQRGVLLLQKTLPGGPRLPVSRAPPHGVIPPGDPRATPEWVQLPALGLPQDPQPG